MHWEFTYFEIMLNADVTQTTVEYLSDKFQTCNFTLKEDENTNSLTMSFHDICDGVLERKFDFFFWPTEDIPDNMDENLDFFTISEYKTSIVFLKGEQRFNYFRSFFILPLAFVGAGPGNPNWLTIEAKSILDDCDVCFYDALVNKVILASMPYSVDKYYVGKRGDSESFDQNVLNDLLCLYMKKGKKVVRLKGGDPGILGRISEEIQALSEFELPFVISPGISAIQGLATSGILLTQRGISDRVILTTARSAGGEVNQLLPNKEASLVIYMGITSIEEIVEQLLDAGYKKDLPAAVAVNLTKTGEKVVYGTLSTIAKNAEKAKLSPPGLIIFGKICDDTLRMFSPYSPILRRKLLITGTGEIAEKIKIEAQRWGAIPIMLFDHLIYSSEDLKFPDYDDIIFFNPRDVSIFYDLTKGEAFSADCQVVCMDEAVDSTVSCLFRKESLIAPYTNGRGCIETLRQHFLESQF